MLTDTVGLTLKYPTSSDIIKNVTADGNTSEIKNTFDVIIACVENIFDTENVYSDLTKKDKEEFLDSLNAQQFEKIQKFFASIPKLTYNADFKCEKCGADNHVIIEGLQNFFA